MGYAIMMLKLHELQACSQEQACTHLLIKSKGQVCQPRRSSLVRVWGRRTREGPTLKRCERSIQANTYTRILLFFFFVVSWLSVSTIAPNTRIIGLKILNCLEKLGKVCGPNQPVMVQSPLPRSPTRSWYHSTPCGWGQVLAHQLSPSSTTTD